jgi:hypothetical protein
MASRLGIYGISKALVPERVHWGAGDFCETNELCLKQASNINGLTDFAERSQRYEFVLAKSGTTRLADVPTATSVAH